MEVGLSFAIRFIAGFAMGLLLASVAGGFVPALLAFGAVVAFAILNSWLDHKTGFWS